MNPQAEGRNLIEIERDGEIHILRMRAGENRVNLDFLAAWNDALDSIESSPGAGALVTTGEGKFYSNGLDLEWLGGEGREHAAAVLSGLDALFARLLAFPMATVAAINGHAFAGGGMLSLAHDYRVMRTDRGFFCLPEIDLAMGTPLTPGMYAVIEARLPGPIVHELLLTGRRYGGEAACAAGIVNAAVPETEVVARAVELVRPLAGKDRATMGAIKRGLYRAALEILERDS
jgi:enoyl-CoA hydratase/carnithine racemase